ncbi:MAG: hypothetical protein B0D92_03555 [Spirochaeta sp. LUC14_002_19_P3]|nr:MAG: hypothetical protein B0D92_03555 [Spirochaeta sp. LUC14_002_19_P3]
MTLAKVVGRAVCSVKHPQYEGEKLLLVQPVDPKGGFLGHPYLAVDSAQAGPGDMVLIIDEGGSARQILGKPSIGAIRTVIAGIVDKVQAGG